jgi:3-methyladenine DNA glycosylase AlkD
MRVHITVNEIIIKLKLLSTSDHYVKLAHFGIKDENALGVKMPDLRRFAKEIGKNHELALELWAIGIHEARLLAILIENPKYVSEDQFNIWVHDFDSCDICDQCCSLLAKTPFTLQKINSYSIEKEEFVKRTAFVLICALVINDKKSEDVFFYPFFDLIEREAWDERNFVRKAVNWALRQIGKRNETLRLKAIECAERILNQGTKSSRWIASNALRELNDEKIIKRIKK